MKQIVVHLGAETENAEEKEANRSEALPYIVILIWLSLRKYLNFES